jgi:hypothetical protein
MAGEGAELIGAIFSGAKKGEGKAAGMSSIEINGQRIPLTPEGLKKAQAEHGNVGEKLAESVRQAVERATEG